MKRKICVLIALLNVGIATAYSQVGLQFAEVHIGRVEMLQGYGFSLFGKSVGDNLALGESIHFGWGRSERKSLGFCVGSSVISIPRHDESAAFFTLGIEARRYSDLNASIRLYWGGVLGGVFAANGYTLSGEKMSDTRWGLSSEFSTGIETSFGRHFYLGVGVSFLANWMISSSYDSSVTLLEQGSNGIMGNKIVLTCGYRL